MTLYQVKRQSGRSPAVTVRPVTSCDLPPGPQNRPQTQAQSRSPSFGGARRFCFLGVQTAGQLHPHQSNGNPGDGEGRKRPKSTAGRGRSLKRPTARPLDGGRHGQCAGIPWWLRSWTSATPWTALPAHERTRRRSAWLLWTAGFAGADRCPPRPRPLTQSTPTSHVNGVGQRVEPRTTLSAKPGFATMLIHPSRCPRFVCAPSVAHRRGVRGQAPRRGVGA